MDIKDSKVSLIVIVKVYVCAWCGLGAQLQLGKIPATYDPQKGFSWF